MAGFGAIRRVRWLALGCLLALSAPAAAQVSPGPLSRAHKSLSGPTQCTSCHQIGVASASLKCLDCHVAIKQRVEAGRGLHATFVARDAGSQACAKCHSEHNGESFRIVQWEPVPGRFDHSKTGYALEGKHASLDCRKCHVAAHIPEVEKQAIGAQALPQTYLGLSRECMTCHEDVHRGQLGKDCSRCHDFNGWKSPLQFNHAKTRFPLTGAHEKVACQKCHVERGPEKTVQFKGLAFGKCADCHADPHKGTFTAGCNTCHNTLNWKQVTAAIKFDHNKTQYPLLGKHFGVTCQSCHHGADFKKPMAHGKCVDCHTPDPHNGQFARRTDRGECAACHTVDGFKPARFDVKAHAATGYPLEGKHARVECAKCHVPAGKATLFKVKFSLCTDCHGDPHERQFAAAPFENRCEQCHTVQTYRPSTFTLARHQQTRFPLTGGHVAVVCMDCHRATAPTVAVGRLDTAFATNGGTNGNGHELSAGAAQQYENRRPVAGPGEPGPSQGKQDVLPGSGQASGTRIAARVPNQYHFQNLACDTCHSDSHNGQFAERMTRVAADGKAAGCEACHSTKAWKDLERFDHSTTRFVLTGAHRAVGCIECHRGASLVTSLRTVDFRSAPSACEECHADIHGGQFAALTNEAAAGNTRADKERRQDAGGTCAECHVTAKWKPSLFDHEKRTTFPLQGGHMGVRCGECHKLVREADGRNVLFYKPTPHECAACHGPIA